MESTGAARPWPLIRALTQDNRFLFKTFYNYYRCSKSFRDFQNGIYFNW